MSVTFSLAFIAGLVSFLSPCCLPLVPAYIGYMGGRLTNTVAAQVGGTAVMTRPTLASRFTTLSHGIAFVLGFSVVFVSIGLLTTAFISVVGRGSVSVITDIISRAGGLLIIFFGLNFMGLLPRFFRYLLKQQTIISTPVTGVAFGAVMSVLLLWALIDWLIALPFITMLILWLFLGGAFTRPLTFWTNTINRLQMLWFADTRKEMVASGHQNYLGSFVMGIVFSAGWTPCIGPIYGSILTMAATGGSPSEAGAMLTAYSLGLGIPFLVTALLLDSAQSFLRKLQRHIHKIELVSGAFLVLIGFLVATGNLQRLSQNFATTFSDFSYNLEDCVVKVSSGEIAFGQVIDCVNGNLPAETSAAPETTAPVVEAPSISDLAAAPGITDLAGSGEVGLEVGKIAPDFQTVDENGETFRLSDHRGEVVLLNFWATWCGPCRVEMPEFEAAYQANKERGFTIVGVNNGETPAAVTAFRADQRVTFPLVMDESFAVSDAYVVQQFPTTYVIGRDGTIRARNYGALTAEQISQFVDDALAS